LIDDESAQKISLSELRAMFCKSKARYSIGLLRTNRRFRVALQLRPLF
jgi:hypothetical protein